MRRLFIQQRVPIQIGEQILRFRVFSIACEIASQISTGEENHLNIQVYATKASLEWHQEHPNELTVKFVDKPREIWRRGNSYNGASATKFTRLPFGHPEAFIEAFANINLAATEAITDSQNGKFKGNEAYDYPNVHDGIHGMAFIEATVASSKNNSAWTKL